MATRDQSFERKAVGYLLAELAKEGFQVTGVYDGEEMHRPLGMVEVLEVVFAVDEVSIRVAKGLHGKSHGILIVLGNADNGEEVVSDWNYTDGDPDGFNVIMDRMIEEIGEAHKHFEFPL